MIALILFAGYALFVVIAGIAGSGDGAAFWVQIGVALLLAAAALWLARWIYRRRAT
jgi:MYXO-CTERM domain-containing protein